VRAELRIASHDQFAELASLRDWLRDEPELRGLVEPVARHAGETEMSGGAIDLLTVLLGSGGIAAVLARSLNTWLKTRRPTVTLTLTVKGRKVTLNAQNVHSKQVDETLKLLHDALSESPDAIDK
jgi:hypothetical protein